MARILKAGGPLELAEGAVHTIDGADISYAWEPDGEGVDLAAGWHPGSCYGHSDENVTNQDRAYGLYFVPGVEFVDGGTGTAQLLVTPNAAAGAFPAPHRLGLTCQAYWRTIDGREKEGGGESIWGSVDTLNNMAVNWTDTVSTNAYGNLSGAAAPYWLRFELAATGYLYMQAWNDGAAVPALETGFRAKTGQTTLGKIGIFARGHTNPDLCGSQLERLELRGSWHVGGKAAQLVRGVSRR